MFRVKGNKMRWMVNTGWARRKKVALLLALCLIFGVVGIAPPMTVNASVIGDDYPYKNNCAGCHSVWYGDNHDDIDPWSFFYRQCTSFVAWRLNSQNGVGFHNTYGNPRCNCGDRSQNKWGHAKHWGCAARSVGITVDQTPSVGSIWWSDKGEYGHVAWVAEVNGDKVTIEEYNWSAGVYTKRKDLPASSASGYIHIKDINTVPQGSPMSDNPGHRPISNGDYFIVSAVEGTAYNPGSRCLTFAGLPDANNTDGANAELWSVYGQEGHLFTVTWLGNGFYKIKLKASQHQNLDVQGDDQHRDANVMSYGGHDEKPVEEFPNNEQWYIKETEDGNGYTIQSKCSGFYLDVVDGNTADGTNIRLWDGNLSNAQRWYFIPRDVGNAANQKIPEGEYQIVSDCNSRKAFCTDGSSLVIGARSDANDQIFQVRWLENGEYEIIHKLTGSSLDVLRGENKRFSQIGLHTPNQGCNQTWLLHYSRNGSFYIATKSSGLVLDYDVTPGSTNRSIYLYCEQNGAGEKWRFIPWGESIGQTLPDGEYQIVSHAGSGRVLGVDEGQTEAGNGINVDLNSRLGDERYTFDVKYLGNGYYSIVNRSFNLALGTFDAWNDGTDAQLGEANSEDVQKWMIKDCGDGSYGIISKSSGLYLSADNFDPQDATGVFMSSYFWQTTWKDLQKWKFVPYDRTVSVESITLDSDSLTLRPGEQVTLQAQVSPEDAADKTLIWESGDESVASVDSDGKVTAKAAGSAEITVRTSNGKTASCLVTVHEHSYDTEWKTDEQNHWKECSCGEKSEESTHTFAWKIDKEATQEAAGVKHEECSACGFKRSENTAIDKLPPSCVHSFGAAWKSDGENHWKECACGEKTEEGAHTFVWKIDKEATEEAAGVKHEECSVCGFKRSENTAIDKLPPSCVHSFGAGWKLDGENHWKECDCGEKSTESAHTFVWKIDKEATEEAAGVKHEECSVCGFKRSEDTAIDKLTPSHVHSFGAGWKSDGENHWKECACGETSELSAHAFAWKIDKAPTEEAAGVKHEECSACGFRRNENTLIDKLPPSGGNQPDGNAPFIKGENSKMGWDVIRDTMEKTEAGKTVSVDMNGAAVVPGSVLNDIKTKGITGTFEMGNGIIWSVNGQSFTTDRTGDINFSVTVRTENIPAELVDRIANGRAATQISLSHDGEFGCTAVLTVNLGSGNAGLMAKLYYYNKTSNQLEDAGSDRIAGEGTAVFAFTHASDYVIMVGEERKTDGSPENPAESQQPDTGGGEEDDSDEERVGSDTEDDVRISGGTPLSPATGEETLCPQWTLAVIVPGVALCIGLVILKRKKRRNC